MGRPWGSGRRTVEQTCSIDIGMLKRAGYFAASKQGHWIWRWNGEIIGTARIEWDGARLIVRNQVIGLWKAGCRFGGQRLWFKCSCGRHVATLYSPNAGPWACRHCYQLTYAMRQAIPRDRHLLRAQRIRDRLGGSRNMMEDFPVKPKGMHWRRYNRMRDIHDRAAEQAFGMMEVWIDKVHQRLS
jgi:hypothetical protein